MHKLSFQQIEKQLQDAKLAQDRLLRDCQGRVVARALTSKDSTLVNDLKAAMSLLQQNLQKLNDCLLWKAPQQFSMLLFCFNLSCFCTCTTSMVILCPFHLSSCFLLGSFLFEHNVIGVLSQDSEHMLPPCLLCFLPELQGSARDGYEQAGSAVLHERDWH